MILRIGNVNVTSDAPVFIIAELSANHQQKFEVAAETVKMAKEVGADAIKLQTYTPDTMTLDCDNEYFRINSGTMWDGRTLYDLYKEAYTPWEWQPKLKQLAEDLGLILFSTPFDHSAVDFLEEMNVPGYKVASFEITDIPLVEYIASKGKPMIISTGIATMHDIENALEACYKVGNRDIALLKCTSSYPADPDDAHLRNIPTLREQFNCVVGLSDHTLGTTIPIAAVAMGACIVEKHFILDKKLGGPDAEFSLEPEEFKNMVTEIRKTEKALGKKEYTLSKRAEQSRIFARSLFISEDIAKGSLFTKNNVRSIRPGMGMPPKELERVLGKQAKRDLKRGTPLGGDMIDGF